MLYISIGDEKDTNVVAGDWLFIGGFTSREPLIPSVQMDKRTGKVKVAASDNLPEKIET